MKKRFLSLLTALAMVVSLAACGSAESDSAAEPVEPDVPVTEQTPVQEETEQTGTAAPEVESGFSTVVVDGLELGAGLIMDEEAIAELDANPDKAIDRAVEPIKPVPDAMLDGTILGDAFYYYRSTLDDTQRQAYDLIRAGIMEGKATPDYARCVDISTSAALHEMILPGVIAIAAPVSMRAAVLGIRVMKNISRPPSELRS